MYALDRRPTAEEQAQLRRGVPMVNPEIVPGALACDAAGRFRFDDLPAGPLVLLVVAPGVASGRQLGGSALHEDVATDGIPITVRFADE